MKRLLLNFLTALSLAAFLATAWQWAASPWGFDRQDQRRAVVGGDAYFLASRAGGLRFVRQRATTSGAGSQTWYTANPGRLGFWQIGTWEGNGAVLMSTRFGPEEPDHAFLGFGWGRAQYRKTTDLYRASERQVTRYTLDYAVVAVPYWALLLAMGLAPGFWLRARLRRRGRIIGGRCGRCGYDLRATPGRCPECGAAPAATRPQLTNTPAVPPFRVQPPAGVPGYAE